MNDPTRSKKIINAEKRTEYVTRDTIMRLLSDEEIARVSTAETAAQLVVGDEYIDLKGLEQGVHRALGKVIAPMGQVLPRKAVTAETWRQIVALLSAHRTEALGRAHTP